MANRSNRPLILGLILGGVALCVFLAGSCAVAWLVVPGGKSSAVVGKRTMEEFESDVMGRSKDYVQDKYGPPNSVQDGYWIYNDIAVVGRDVIQKVTVKKTYKLQSDQQIVLTADNGKGGMIIGVPRKAGTSNHAVVEFFRGRVSKVEWSVPIKDMDISWHPD